MHRPAPRYLGYSFKHRLSYSAGRKFSILSHKFCWSYAFYTSNRFDHNPTIRKHSTTVMHEEMAAQVQDVDSLPSRSKANGEESASIDFSQTTSESAVNVHASFTAINPVDVYRTHISEALAPIAGVAAAEIYQKLQWTQTQDKGDLTLAVPALRIKGKKPNEQAAEWAQRVSLAVTYHVTHSNVLFYLVSVLGPAEEPYCSRHIPTIFLQIGAAHRTYHPFDTKGESNVWYKC